ncbi:MAG: DUF4262 domain-containing protein [Planctomycetes bacterium]|nr:DUF4262 domain-containing protein [Planctomycetota bacterium]
MKGLTPEQLRIYHARIATDAAAHEHQERTRARMERALEEILDICSGPAATRGELAHAVAESARRGLNMEHSGRGACSSEEAMTRITAWESDMLAKHGWYVHLVSDDRDSPTGFNAHTHGLETHGLLNFQIVCPMRAETANTIFAMLVHRARESSLVAGMELSEILGDGLKVRLMLAEESRRKVLRAILPDMHGKFGQEAQEPFGDQLKGCLAVE